MIARPWLALVESNTTGSGRHFWTTARARGLRPVVLTADADRYPQLRADHVDTLVLDTADRDEVRRACTQLARTGLAGVTSSSEYYIGTAAVVAAALGLPAPDGAAIDLCRRKDRQRDVLEAAGVAVPCGRAASTVEQARTASGQVGLPVVVKPVFGSGSVGVRLCATPGDVTAHAGELLAGTVNERGMPVPSLVLVEEYVSGPEFSVETFGSQVIGVTRKHLGPAPYFLETGHDFPAPLSTVDEDALGRSALAALAALGLDWGAAHTEIRLSSRGPVVIEVNPRLAGGMIPALVGAATGIDLVDRCVAAATGDRPSWTPDTAVAAAVRFLIATSGGEVIAVSGLAGSRAVPGVRDVSVRVAVGDRIPVPSHSFRDRIGHVLAVGPDLAAAVHRASTALAGIAVTIAARDRALPAEVPSMLPPGGDPGS